MIITASMPDADEARRMQDAVAGELQILRLAIDMDQPASMDCLLPADTFERVNRLGPPLCARAIPYRDRDERTRIGVEISPSPICTKPQAPGQGERT